MKKTLQELNFKQGEILAIDKPLGWSSFDVVRKLRNLVQAKTGHSGTLDPLATGLLLLGTGAYTKKLTELQGLPKEYVATFFIGATTPSYDRESDVDQEWDISAITEEHVKEAISQLIGVQMQHPPVFSAIKVNGQRSYEMARKGTATKLDAREIEITYLDILEIRLPYVKCRIGCTKGTYIRSLAHDFGAKLGIGAFLYDLSRTAVGEYRLEDAWNFDELVDGLKRLKEDLNQHESI